VRSKSGNGCAHRDRWNPIGTSAIYSIFRPMRFLGFNHEKGAPKSKPPVPLSSWSLRQMVCSKFSRSGWSVVRSASLAKVGTSKKRRSPRLYKVPAQSNKVSPRTLQTALVYEVKAKLVPLNVNVYVPLITITSFVQRKITLNVYVAWLSSVINI
jgi:hypothetical protein